MEPLHVVCPVGKAKGEKYFHVALEILTISKSNAVLSNQSEPVTLPTLMQMLEKLEPRFLA